MYKNELLLVLQARNNAKAKRRYSKEKTADYYLQNKDATKEKLKIDTKICHKKKKTRFKSIEESDISN